MIHFDLPRFGFDADAVGRLIDGRLPDNEDELWSLVDAPRFRIEKLLSEHRRAQDLLRECAEAGRPFALFLRSFQSESKRTRDGGVFSDISTIDSIRVQQALKLLLGEESVPLIKLHGGSDAALGGAARLPGDREDVPILSAHSENWLAIVSELIEGASLIAFLIGQSSAGVGQELELIRTGKRQERSLVLILEPKPSKPGDVEALCRQLADFPHLFVLNRALVPNSGGLTSGHREVVRALLHDATPSGNLEKSIEADFSYLEPAYAASDDYAAAQRYLWLYLRRLRVTLDDTYWAALKAHGIIFRQLRLQPEWMMAHRLYGIALAVGDLGAATEALGHLRLLYTLRGSLYSFNLAGLAGELKELGRSMFALEPPDTESKYTEGEDPLSLSPSIDLALRLCELANQAQSRGDLDGAGYLYHAAVICAQRCEDLAEGERHWIISRMLHDWARFQAGTTHREWAEVNYSFSLKLSRDLAASDPGRYLGDVALFLNNLGSLYQNLGRHEEALEAFTEALKIRRDRASDAEDYLVDLYTSLRNLGNLKAALGDYDAARQLYLEGLAVCEQRLREEPEVIVYLTDLQLLMSLCLVDIPELRSEGRRYAERASENLATAVQLNPARASELQAMEAQTRRAYDDS